MELIFNSRQVKCPVCNHSFQFRSPGNGSASLERRDPDMCPHYQGANPLYYTAWVCPSCGYAALKEHFSSLTTRERDMLRLARDGAKDHQKHDFTQAERNLFAAMLSLQLALKCYQHRSLPPEVRAGVELRLAWICRYGNDRKREKVYLEKAIALYGEAYNQGLASTTQMSEAMVAYLIGTMHHRIGRSQEALDWFLKAIQGDPDKGDVFRMAREQIFEAKESIRFFEYLSEVEILRPLEIEEIAMLSTQLQHRTVRPGKTICQEGEPGQSMFIAMAGTTRISIGDREVVRIAPGEVFGEMSLLTGHPRVATVVAEDTVELLEIDRVVFKTILQANPPVATEIARIVSERQHQNDRLMGEMLPEGTPESAQERQSGESLLNRVKSYFELP